MQLLGNFVRSFNHYVFFFTPSPSSNLAFIVGAFYRTSVPSTCNGVTSQFRSNSWEKKPRHFAGTDIVKLSVLGGMTWVAAYSVGHVMDLWAKLQPNTQNPKKDFLPTTLTFTLPKEMWYTTLSRHPILLPQSSSFPRVCYSGQKVEPEPGEWSKEGWKWILIIRMGKLKDHLMYYSYALICWAGKKSNRNSCCLTGLALRHAELLEFLS